MQEQWKYVIGYEGLYKISNEGKLKSCERKIHVAHRGYDGFKTVKEKEMKTRINNMGYESVKLCKDNKYSEALIHRLVAQAFIPNPNNLPCVNHKDENPLNNCVDNLEWCTQKYNCNFGNRNSKISKSRIGMKFTEEHIKNLKKAGKQRVNDVFREKMRRVHLGSHLSEEHKQKISWGVKRHFQNIK